MAQFSYENYAAQQEARKSASTGTGVGPEVHFMNEFLRNDGDVAVVRFPYHTMADITFETTHSVTFPNRKYPSRVRCEGHDCHLCQEGIKLDTRFFVKAIVYVVDETTGTVKLVNAVWDRPSAFADIDIKNLMQEYGDISEQLFKIKRNGTGTATRYTISIIMNKTVYNPEVYKADFSEIEKVDPVRILSKSYQQYAEALNPGTTTEAPAVQNAQPAVMNTSAQTVAPQPAVVNPQVTPVAGTPVQTSSQVQEPVQEQPRRQTRYQF